MIAENDRLLTRQQMIAENDQLLTRQQAADRLNIRPQTLAVWAMTGKNLAFVKLGRTVRYRLSDIRRLIERGTVGGEAK